MHDRGIIHRDLKSSNVFLDTCNEPDDAASSCRVKIGDFGLAAVKTVLAETVNQQVQPSGSVLWMVNYFLIMFTNIIINYFFYLQRHPKSFNKKILTVILQVRMYMLMDAFFLKCLAENYRTHQSVTKSRFVFRK